MEQTAIETGNLKLFRSRPCCIISNVRIIHLEGSKNENVLSQPLKMNMQWKVSVLCSQSIVIIFCFCFSVVFRLCMLKFHVTLSSCTKFLSPAGRHFQCFLPSCGIQNKKTARKKKTLLQDNSILF